MRLTHKILDTGYHYVRAGDYAHLFAQWSVGARLERENVSYGEGYIDYEKLRDFMDKAQRLADGVSA